PSGQRGRRRASKTTSATATAMSIHHDGRWGGGSDGALILTPDDGRVPDQVPMRHSNLAGRCRGVSKIVVTSTARFACWKVGPDRGRMRRVIDQRHEVAHGIPCD